MKFTVLFKHTAPHTTWGEADPGARGTNLEHVKIYGAGAGKPFDERMFLWVIEAPTSAEAQRIAERDACDGAGTIVFLVLEGAVRPLVQNDLVISLKDKDIL